MPVILSYLPDSPIFYQDFWGIVKYLGFSLMKPFVLSILAKVIHNVLDKKQ
jgi:hypothetical protein